MFDGVDGRYWQSKESYLAGVHSLMFGVVVRGFVCVTVATRAGPHIINAITRMHVYHSRVGSCGGQFMSLSGRPFWQPSHRTGMVITI